MDEPTRQWLICASNSGRFNQSFWDQINTNIRAGNIRAVKDLVYLTGQAFTKSTRDSLTSQISRREDTPVPHAAATNPTDHKTVQYQHGTISRVVPSEPRFDHFNLPSSGTGHHAPSTPQSTEWTNASSYSARQSMISTDMANPSILQPSPTRMPSGYTGALSQQSSLFPRQYFPPNPYQTQYPPSAQLDRPPLLSYSEPSNNLGAPSHVPGIRPPTQLHGPGTNNIIRADASAQRPDRIGFSSTAQLDPISRRPSGPLSIPGRSHVADSLTSFQSVRVVNKTAGGANIAEVQRYQNDLSPGQSIGAPNRSSRRPSTSRSSPCPTSISPSRLPASRPPTVYRGSGTSESLRPIFRPHVPSLQAGDITIGNPRPLRELETNPYQKSNPPSSSLSVHTNARSLGQQIPWGADFLRFKRLPTPAGLSTSNISERRGSFSTRSDDFGSPAPPWQGHTSTGFAPGKEDPSTGSPQILRLPGLQAIDTKIGTPARNLRTKPPFPPTNLPQPRPPTPQSPQRSSPPFTPSPEPPYIAPNPQPQTDFIDLVPQFDIIAGLLSPNTPQQEIDQFYAKVHCFDLTKFTPLDGFITALTQQYNTLSNKESFRVFDFLYMHSLLFRGMGENMQILLWRRKRNSSALWTPPQKMWSAEDDLPCKSQDTIMESLLQGLKTVAGLREEQLVEGIPARSDQAIEARGNDGKVVYGWSVAQTWEIKLMPGGEEVGVEAPKELEVEWFDQRKVEAMSDMLPVWKQQILKVFAERKERDQILLDYRNHMQF